MPYSAVTHPLLWSLRKRGTPSSNDAVQMTLVRPISINTEPDNTAAVAHFAQQNNLPFAVYVDGGSDALIRPDFF